MTSPSGKQYSIAYGDHCAVLVEVGGGIRSYKVGDRRIIDGYDEAAMCDGARGQTLIPWPNRVRDGEWSWRGRDLQLPLTEPAKHNASHGLVRWMPWTATNHDADAVTLTCTSYPQPGYPWMIDITNSWNLTADGLSVTTVITNRSDDTAPVAAGFHPYLATGTELVDDIVLTVPVATHLLVDDQLIPIGSEPVAGTALDFSTPRPIGTQIIDDGFTDLARDDDGRARVRLANPGDGSEVVMWVDESYRYLQVFTGDTLAADRRRRGLAVEPMTAPANALASGESLVVLDPGQAWSGEWGISTG